MIFSTEMGLGHCGSSAPVCPGERLQPPTPRRAPIYLGSTEEVELIERFKKECGCQ